ncbi:acyltransferase family protein [Janibacter sp. HTCC2649]|uniref:acyltransferase family protein n=1 Tax=Janibacter sp. HTCC2649 TaxID=313589 RepID=UPI0011D24B2D|nr:acyltransferase family protein [Janibacter sp. HTCC2649]
MADPVTAVDGDAVPRRVLGLDAARGLAVVAMVIAHGVPFISERVSTSGAFVLQQVNDLASPLFVLVMGVAAGLVFDRASAARGVGRATVRGLALIALGVGLEQLNHWVAVILHILGLLLIIGTPLLVLGTRWLVGISAVLFVGGPWVIEAVTRAGGGVAGMVATTADWAANPLVQWLVTNVHYRVLTLLPLFLVGAVLARRGLGDERTSWWCALGGLTMLWASFAAELLGHPVVFSGDYPDQVQENGLALAAYGIVMAVDIAAGGRPAVYAVLRPLSLVGQVALSLYVFHVVLLVPLIPRFPAGGWLPFGLLLFVALVTAWAWARFVGRGPVEWLVDRLSPSRRPRASLAA